MTIAGRYRLVRKLGQGGMGEVWLAEDGMLNRAVAIKRLFADAPSVGPQDLDRLLREARIAAQVRHSAVVAVYDLLVADGQRYVVMEYVPGVSLAERLRVDGPLRVAEAARIIADAASALAAAHRIGVVHRDVKPANIFLEADGSAKLGDFGIARVSGDVSVTATGMMFGTVAYMAPDVARGTPATSASDVWSLGISLYAALQGVTPFEAENTLGVLARITTEPAAPARAAGPLRPVLAEMLQRDPAVRPGAAQVHGWLTAVARGAAPAGLEETSARTVVRPAPATRPAVPVPAPWAPAYEPQPARSWHEPVAPPAAARRPATLWWLVAAVTAVIVAGVAVALVVALRPAGRAQAGAAPPSASITTRSPSSPAPSVSNGRTVTVTHSSTPQVTPTVSPTSAGSVPVQSYAAPGGLTVSAPEGWLPDTSAGIDHIRDFDDPASAGATQGTYFRIGIGNIKPTGTFALEAKQAADFLRSRYQGTIMSGPDFAQFLGAQCADIEYTDPVGGVTRHGIERIWRYSGQTMIIQASGLDQDWAGTRALFEQLVASAQLH